MKTLLITVALLLVSCSPIVHEMEDKQAYDKAKAMYDQEKTFSSDSEYEEVEELLAAFLNEYEYSSYWDNAAYYYGRLLQEWAEKKTGDLKLDKYESSLEQFRAITAKSSLYDESLYRIAESLDEMHQAGGEVSVDEVVEAYEKVYTVSPKSKNGMKAENRIQELDA